VETAYGRKLQFGDWGSKEIQSQGHIQIYFPCLLWAEEIISSLNVYKVEDRDIGVRTCSYNRRQCVMLKSVAMAHHRSGSFLNKSFHVAILKNWSDRYFADLVPSKFMAYIEKAGIKWAIWISTCRWRQGLFSKARTKKLGNGTLLALDFDRLRSPKLESALHTLRYIMAVRIWKMVKRYIITSNFSQRKPNFRKASSPRFFEIRIASEKII